MFDDGLSERYLEAFAYAARLHGNLELGDKPGDQFRKGTTIPYISHPIAVASIVMELGGSEDQVIAALLHDLVEDRGGVERLADIKLRFGESVAHIVENLSDAMPAPGERKDDWRPRKERYLSHLTNVDQTVMLVSAADKLHNIRSIIRDYRELGEELWGRFNGGKDGTLWYYTKLLDIYDEKIQYRKLWPLVGEMRQCLDELRTGEGR